MIPTRPTIPDVRKIVVIRTGAIGDLLVTLPAIYAIRVAYPAAEIILLGDPDTNALAGFGRIPVNRCLELPPIANLRKDGYLDWEECGDFIEMICKEKPDLVINFQGRGKTANPFINSFGAKHTLSFSSVDTENTDLFVQYEYFQSEQIRFLELVEKIGARPVMLEPKIRLLNKDHDEALELLGAAVTSPFIVINPFANDIRRTWPVHNYLPVIRELHENGYQIMLSGNVEQREKLNQLNTETGNICFNSAGLFSVPQLAATLSHASLLIAPDTGPLHLARAVNTATVGIYWAPNLINWGPLTRDIHKPVISWELKCPVCGTIPVYPFPFEPRDQCSHNVSFVRNIKPSQVILAAFESLNIIPKSSLQ